MQGGQKIAMTVGNIDREIFFLFQYRGCLKILI